MSLSELWVQECLIPAQLPLMWVIVGHLNRIWIIKLLCVCGFWWDSPRFGHLQCWHLQL